MNGDNQTIELALTAIAAAALALQTIFLVAVLIIARNAARSMREEMEHYRSSLLPIVTKVRDITENLAPKVEQASSEIAAIARSLRVQVEEIKAASDDIIAKAQRQTGRLDRMVSAAFDRVERAGEFVTNSVARPMRQISGIVAAVRAAVETLRDPGAGQSGARQSGAGQSGGGRDGGRRDEAGYQPARTRYSDGEHAGIDPMRP